MSDKVKLKLAGGWGLITYGIVCFGMLFFIPWFPTVALFLYHIGKIWLVLTIGWAISWYFGMYLWNDERKKIKPQL
jgi:hypothetical protein